MAGKKQGRRSKCKSNPRATISYDIKDRAFALEYIRTWDVHKAAKAVGCRGHNAAHIYIAKPRVREIIEEEMQKCAAEVSVTPAMLINEVILSAFSNLDDYGTWEGDQFVMFPSKDLTRNQKAAIESIECKPTKSGTQVKFKLYNKTKAQELLAKLLGMLKPDPEPNQRDQAEVLAKRIKAALGQMDEQTGDKNGDATSTGGTDGASPQA